MHRLVSAGDSCSLRHCTVHSAVMRRIVSLPASVRSLSLRACQVAFVGGLAEVAALHTSLLGKLASRRATHCTGRSLRWPTCLPVFAGPIKGGGFLSDRAQALSATNGAVTGGCGGRLCSIVDRASVGRLGDDAAKVRNARSPGSA